MSKGIYVVEAWFPRCWAPLLSLLALQSAEGVLRDLCFPLWILQGHAALTGRVGAGACTGLGDSQHSRVNGAEILIGVLRLYSRNCGCIRCRGVGMLKSDWHRLPGKIVITRIVVRGLRHLALLRIAAQS